jgi:DNA-binding CsgD family transcriptional regulator
MSPVELLEREHELAAIGELLQAGGLLIIEGSAGIGKTSLMREAVARAPAAGRRALVAGGSVLEATYPFGLARQLFEPLLRDDQPGLLLAGAGAAAVPAIDPDAVGETADPSGFAVLRGLAAVTVNAAEAGPLLLVLDDVQWGDAPSLRFVGFLARRLDGPDIAVCAAIRRGEPDAPEQLLDELRSAPQARWLKPAALSLAATAALVRGRDPAAADVTCERCHDATRGNPLLVAEVIRAMADDDDAIGAAAAGIGAGVRRRIQRADPSALRVACAAAVLGEDASLANVVALSGLEMTAVGRAAAALSAAAVLTGSEPYRFSHPLVRSAVLETLNDGERVSLHRDAATVLSTAGAADERVAAHLLATPGTGDQATLARLRAAAALALSRGAPRSAILLLKRALAEPPSGAARSVVLRELGTAERLAGDGAGVSHLRAAHAMATDALERALLARQVAIAQYELSNYDDAAHTLSLALREAPENLDADARDSLRVGLLTVALLVSNLDREQLLADLARGAAPTQASVGIALRLAALGAELADAQAVPNATVEIEALLAANPPAPDGFDAHTTLWFALCMCERFDGLRAQLDEVERAPDNGWTRRQFAINLARSRLEQRLGQLDASTATHEANLEFGMDNATGRLLTLGGLASVCVDRGDVSRAVALAASIAVPARQELHLSQVHWALGRVAAASGNDQAAARSFDAGCAIARAFPGQADVIWEEGGSDRIACYLRLGRDDEAHADIARTLATARQAKLIGLEGIALRLHGMSTADRRTLEASVGCLQRTPMLLEQARSLCELGAHLRRAGDRTAARDPLRRALGLAHACGARPLAARARAELLLAGARPRRDAQAGRDALTSAERRVARLAADGHTNREIGQQLFITTKTVEGHLARIFRKLDVHHRTDLAAALDATVVPATAP